MEWPSRPSALSRWPRAAPMASVQVVGPSVRLPCWGGHGEKEPSGSSLWVQCQGQLVWGTGSEPGKCHRCRFPSSGRKVLSFSESVDNCRGRRGYEAGGRFTELLGHSEPGGTNPLRCRARLLARTQASLPPPASPGFGIRGAPGALLLDRRNVLPSRVALAERGPLPGSVLLIARRCFPQLSEA